MKSKVNAKQIETKSVSKDNIYEWIHSKTSELYLPKRRILLIIYVLLLFFGVFLAVLQSSVREGIALLYFWLFSVTLGLFVGMTFYESYSRDSRVEQCRAILNNDNIKLNAAKRCESRAAADIGAARVSIFLPGLILAFMIPLTFSALTDTYPLDESITLASVEKVDKIPSSTLETLLSDEWAAMLLVLFSIIITMVLSLQLERANISITIQHACIEYEAVKYNKSSEKITTMMYENLKKRGGKRFEL